MTDQIFQQIDLVLAKLVQLINTNLGVQDILSAHEAQKKLSKGLLVDCVDLILGSFASSFVLLRRNLLNYQISLKLLDILHSQLLEEVD